MHEGGFAGAGNAGENGEACEWNGGGDIFQVICLTTGHDEEGMRAGNFPALAADWVGKRLGKCAKGG